MTIPTLNPNTAAWTWVDATTNTDGSPLTAGEVTGYNIGVGPASIPAGGIYPINIPVDGPTATQEAFSAAVATAATMLKPGTYFSAVQSVGPVNSAFSNEFEFQISQPVPAAPTGFTGA